MTCACTAPTRPDAYVCDRCSDGYARNLDSLAEWLAEELETSVSGAKGAGYCGAGGSGPSGPGSSDLRINYAAAELSRRLTSLLSATVEVVSRPREDAPSTLGPMAGWLRWRVDVLGRHPHGPSLMGRLEGLVARAERVVDRPPDHQYLGTCTECPNGALYAVGAELAARCNLCRAEVDAGERRTHLLAELDDRLVTAAEAARLSTYLGLRLDRDKVRKRVNTWRLRGRVEAHEGVTGESLVRFGEVCSLLLVDEARA